LKTICFGRATLDENEFVMLAVLSYVYVMFIEDDSDDLSIVLLIYLRLVLESCTIFEICLLRSIALNLSISLWFSISSLSWSAIVLGNLAFFLALSA
jgi:hypothetical protein